MPLVIRKTARRDPEVGPDDDAADAVEGEAVMVPRMAEWQTRLLTDDEVSNAIDATAMWLLKQGFTMAHAGQILYSGEPPAASKERLRMRLSRMSDAFAAGGFDPAKI